ncbi:HpcH/HpaI aldolase/citrate lyase family protein [Aeromicrobium alkaliterrae]|uniref:CoA ester lyase n=1 Tax=Aeromicrobium alkaliterrae TaxID=302168 RepID=A0ABN2JJZ6_9ACTN
MTAVQVDQSPAVPVSMARSWRLVSAASIDACSPAELTAADVTVLDLEAGCPDELKAAGRDAVTRYADEGHRVWIRANGATTGEWAADMELAASHPRIEGVVLAMAEAGDEVRASLHAGGKPVVAMVETARAFVAFSDIATSGTVRIAFGTGDFRRDLGIGNDPTALLHARSQLVLMSRGHDLAPPIDGPTVVDDADVTRTDSVHARTLGMTGRVCLTHTQTEVVNEVFAPSATDLHAARSLLASPPEGYAGAIAPRLAHARQVVHRAGVFGVDAP